MNHLPAIVLLIIKNEKDVKRLITGNKEVEINNEEEEEEHKLSKAIVAWMKGVLTMLDKDKNLDPIKI